MTLPVFDTDLHNGSRENFEKTTLWYLFQTLPQFTHPPSNPVLKSCFMVTESFHKERDNF